MSRNRNDLLRQRRVSFEDRDRLSENEIRHFSHWPTLAYRVFRLDSMSRDCFPIVGRCFTLGEFRALGCVHVALRVETRCQFAIVSLRFFGLTKHGSPVLIG